jgi:hypothetical protein
VVVENKREKASDGAKNMRKVAQRLTAGLFGLLAAFTSAANCSVDMCSDVLVDQIYVESGTNIWIRTSGTETSLTVCAPDSGVYLWLDGNTPQKKEVLAVLMMAYAMEKPVYFRLANGARGCHISYVFMNR